MAEYKVVWEQSETKEVIVKADNADDAWDIVMQDEAGEPAVIDASFDMIEIIEVK